MKSVTTTQRASAKVAELQVTPPKSAANTARVKGYSGKDAVEPVAAKTVKTAPVSTLDAFCTFPELTMAEWVRGLGMKFEPSATIDDCMMNAMNVFHPTMSRSPKYEDLYKAVHQHPENLAHLDGDKLDLSALQYCRVAASREFTSLWVNAENIMKAATWVTQHDLDSAQRDLAERQITPDLYDLVQRHAAASNDVKAAICNYARVDDVFSAQALTARELLRLVARPQPEGSRGAVLIDALRRFAMLERTEPLTFGYRQSPSIDFTLKNVGKLATLLAGIDVVTKKVNAGC